MPALIAFGFQYWKYIAVVAALLAVFGWHKAQVSKAYRSGVEAERTAARIEAGKRIVEMEKSNAEFQKLPARDRCIAFMRDSGLPIDNCADGR